MMGGITESMFKKSILFLFIAVQLLCLLGGCQKNVEEPPVIEETSPDSISLPVLLYHEINEDGKGDSSIAEEVFLEHLDGIQEAGLQTVTLQQVIDYVENGTPLPEKPILITFDDGYTSNYEIAWPALRERGMTATIFVIGVSVGKDTYRYTDQRTIPHFSYEQAQEMIQSGVIAIQSHTYDLHHYPELEGYPYRLGVLPLEEETVPEYHDAMFDDFGTAITALRDGAGVELLALAYPHGLHTQESEEVCSELGIKATFTTVPEHTQLVKGDPSSLRLMGRYSIDDCSVLELFEEIGEVPPPSADPNNAMPVKGKLNDPSGLTVSRRLSQKNGAYVYFDVTNLGKNSVTITVNGQEKQAILPGKTGQIKVAVDADLSTYTFRATAQKKGGTVNIKYQISQK